MLVISKDDWLPISDIERRLIAWYLYRETIEDIPVDGTIKWSDIKEYKLQKFKTIDDEDQI